MAATNRPHEIDDAALRCVCVCVCVCARAYTRSGHSHRHIDLRPRLQLRNTIIHNRKRVMQNSGTSSKQMFTNYLRMNN